MDCSTDLGLLKGTIQGSISWVYNNIRKTAFPGFLFSLKSMGLRVQGERENPTAGVWGLHSYGNIDRFLKANAFITNNF